MASQGRQVNLTRPAGARGRGRKLSSPPSVTISDSDKLITVGIPTTVHLVNMHDPKQTGTGFQTVVSSLDRVVRIPDDTREKIHRRVWAKLQIKGELFPRGSKLPTIDFLWEVQEDIEGTVAEVLRDSTSFQAICSGSHSQEQEQEFASTNSYQKKWFTWLSEWDWTARIQDDDHPVRTISISTTDSRLAQSVPQYDLQLHSGCDPRSQVYRPLSVRFIVPQLVAISSQPSGEMRFGKISDALLQQVSLSTASLLKKAEESSIRCEPYAEWFEARKGGLLYGLVQRTENLIRQSTATEVLLLPAGLVPDTNRQAVITGNLPIDVGRPGPFVDVWTSARPVIPVSSASTQA